MQCQVCNFDNTPLAGEPVPEHCEGCGARVSGGQKSFPGFEVLPDGHDEYEQTDPVIVDDELRAKYPNQDLEHVLVVKESEYTWGRGIGMEPDGYLQTLLVTVERSEEPCPECGSTEIEARSSTDRAGVHHAYVECCNRCGTTLEEGHY